MRVVPVAAVACADKSKGGGGSGAEVVPEDVDEAVVAPATEIPREDVGVPGGGPVQI